ncbi:MAG: hypothetical protein DSZ21_01760, partial [Tenericutes bacterium]
MLPINATNSKVVNNKVIIDQEKVNEFKEKNNITDDFVAKLHKNDTLISPTGEIYYVVGHEYKRN